MVEWSYPKTTRQRKYGPLLEEVKKGQAEHGSAWAEIARFESVQSGRSCAHQLKTRYEDEGYEFKSAIDKDTEECVVYARYGKVTDE